ncbi:hypothetical protein HK105_207673 [Polyrhizophydium stewartii]|uniref:AB hydrolase-1 domain-containing protein n=1 Tax=Polyrhizophydium stewartii TaxID=2732419 RepID=A0ABR4MZU5_9FUNG
MARPRFSMTVRLRSGEQLSYADVGDKSGFPVLWFAGPNSNRLLMAVYEDMALELGLRLVCFDRPGRGGSTPLRYPKMWEFRSWPVTYVDELTDILGIERFFVIGHSLGATYALACYDQLKHKIIGSLRLMATWAPSNLPCMPVSYALQRSLPTRMLRGMYSIGYSSTVTTMTTAQLPTQMGQIGVREQVNANDTFVYEVLKRVAQDHTNDAFKAFELDWLLALEINKKFGFDHRSLQCSIKCWHGMDDTVAPLGAAMWMQREMKHFLLYAVEGATHNILLDFAIVKAIFSDIAKEGTLVLTPAKIASSPELAVTPSLSSTASAATPSPSSDAQAAADKAAADKAAADKAAAAPTTPTSNPDLSGAAPAQASAQ